LVEQKQPPAEELLPAAAEEPLGTDEVKEESSLEYMTVEDISKSLKLIGMHNSTIENFYNECVDGSLLLTLTDQMLKDEFKMSVFHRHKISQFICGWRPKHDNLLNNDQTK